MKQFILALFIFVLPFQLLANDSWNDSLSQKEELETELKVYPNPVKNNQVTIAFQTKEMKEVRLVNITGKEVLREILDFPEQKKTVKLNNIPNGIYILQIKTTEDKVVSKKLMISRD
ncbi:T9SS type A sorting domain-containing protein [Maribellus sediminis]|uniref:T9SS type A sorting domain-containing protein n=1 Tax=Maribellus sediminis TaxID=2696285 RepID=UPI001430B827|nr:T9SS type A sorting domain-containing protein [Maribellus sediminis]